VGCGPEGGCRLGLVEMPVGPRVGLAGWEASSPFFYFTNCFLLFIFLFVFKTIANSFNIIK
jgi:hypothetical protein